MTINALDSGLLGLQRGFQTATTASGNIARQTSGSEANDVSGAGADLAQELVSQRVGQQQTEASAQVVKAADETLGTLIDLFV
jgi:flagellar hook protein FlgE